MSQPAIEISGLSKRYVIEHESRHDTLRDTLHHAARKLWRRARWGTGFEREEFWALRDVSFSVQPGEVVGIIGRNGAGKSTLLKILSRITEPTAGKITLRGRVASLLEVGTGFHPDLTGRENIFLNGAILGMSRAEIRKKFDEIVAFAEVERFLDTPVKRYSSGMYVRLAFAVAAHLEPEILIVDEVLAVGDAQFQKKCLGKMQDVARNGGRTVLFVSHNLGAVQGLCQRVLFLQAGGLRCDASADAAITAYLSEGASGADSRFHGRDYALRVDRVAFASGGAFPAIELDLTLRAAAPRRLALEVILSTGDGTPVAFCEAGSLDFSRSLHLQAGETPTRWQIDVSRFANGLYFLRFQLVELGVSHHVIHDHPVAVEVARAPRPGADRVLELGWRGGALEVDLNRLPRP